MPDVANQKNGHTAVCPHDGFQNQGTADAHHEMTNLKSITLSERNQAQELILNDSIYVMVQTRQNPCGRNQNSGCLWIGVGKVGIDREEA